MKKNVALIAGGKGYEREISEVSAEHLFSLIDRQSYNVYIIHIDSSGEWYISQAPCQKYEKDYKDRELFRSAYPVLYKGKSGFFTEGKVLGFDCVIPCLHGDFGEDGIIQSALCAADINYVGQDVFASAVCSDKIFSKIIAESLGIPTARWRLSDSESAEEAKQSSEKEIGYPMFIKPARLGSSIGAYPVREACEFIPAFESASRYSERLLIEELIEFDYELECSFLEGGEPELIPGGRILSGGEFYDFDSKYVSSAIRTEVRHGTFSDAERKAEEYSRALISLIGIRHLCRLDFFISSGKAVFNEINVFPGMTEASLYPKLVEGTKKDRRGFINRLIEKVSSRDRRI